LPDLSKKRERDRLKVQRDPHYLKLAHGAYLGFRRGPDTWTARYRSRDGVQQYLALTEVASYDYDGAKRAAEDWFRQLGASAVRSVKRATVRAAAEAYLAHLMEHGRAEAAKEALGRFKLTLWSSPLADLPLESATRDDFRDWRRGLTAGRQPRSINRQVRAVIAALNFAVEEGGHIGNPMAWQLQPLADDTDEEGETAVFLDSGQRRALIAAAEPHAADFFRGLELTGARPKELAGALVRDFDGAAIKLSHRKGRPVKLRVRFTVLGTDGVEFFSRVVKGRNAKDPLFTEDGSQPWRRHMWARKARAAVARCNESGGSVILPDGVGAYAFRHARISELLQLHNIDPISVAHQTGTSLAMIERAYMRFIPSAMREKLAAVKA